MPLRLDEIWTFHVQGSFESASLLICSGLSSPKKVMVFFLLNTFVPSHLQQSCSPIITGHIGF